MSKRPTDEAIQEALEEHHDGVVAAMRHLRSAGHAFNTQWFLERAQFIRDQLASPCADAGTVEHSGHRRATTSSKTLVFTCAQNNTKLHDKFWASLMHFLKHNGAELHVSRFTYNKAAMSQHGAKTGTDEGQDGVWYDSRIEPYVSDASLQVAPDLVWCGELNILPTRVTPLSTLKSYTRRASGIIPHVKMHLESTPVMKGSDPRLLLSTGTITRRNYIQKISGQVAEFHHVFGAVLVEVDDEGHWWARQLNADNDGVFYDKDMRYSPDGAGKSTERPQTMVHGDIHAAKTDMDVINAVFANGGVLDQLSPRKQFFHDLVDFAPRNHHNIKDPHFRWTHKAQNPVRSEFRKARSLLRFAGRNNIKSFVVTSNHDTAIGIWLKNTDGFFDPINRDFWLECNYWMSRNINCDPKPFAYALTAAEGVGHVDVTVVHEDDSVVVGGVEHGLHGHLGPNGSRGSPKNLRVLGKANTGHTHSPSIIDGVYTTGVYGKLDMGYNKGPSSWAHAFTLQYANGKRALYIFRNGKPWRGFEQ